MAHHIYTTDAFVLDSQLSGEADRYYTLFTKELGLIRATARGVRLQKSKLRYSLQDFSRSTISLVRGKEVWRITSARINDSLFARYREDKAVLHLVAQITTLLRRLLGGEEKNEELFTLISDGISFLEQKSYSAQELKYLEIIIVLRILNNLGYLRHVEEFKLFLREPLTETLLISLEPLKAQALKEINMSLKETQL
jgi:DNA repair protein RecO (recombination protein O)